MPPGVILNCSIKAVTSRFANGRLKVRIPDVVRLLTCVRRFYFGVLMSACSFNCKILINIATEQLAFTGCSFQDCNIDQLAPDEARALIACDNIFERPIAERKADFERRLAEAFAR